MNKHQTLDLCVGLLLILTPSVDAGALTPAQDDDEVGTETSRSDGPNFLDLLISDEERSPPSPQASGGYLAGLVVRQDIEANWISSEIGIQLYLDGVRLDPRRYLIDWKVVVSPYSVAKVRFVEPYGSNYNQKIQIQAPINSNNGRLIGSIEIEAKVTDREQPDKAPEVLTQSLRELLANGREGM